MSGLFRTLLLLVCLCPPLLAQRTLETVIPPGANFDKAEFRLWLPEGTAPLQAVLVLVPGSNGDGRAQAEDPVWQAFAAKHHLALLGCRFTDKPHEQGFLEEYVNVSKGSGQALLDALRDLSGKGQVPSLGTAPLLLWGMSAGGQFNYEFTAWRPDRVRAFVVNKGGIYYTALAPRAARNVPGFFFTGGKDLEFRNATITGIFAVNRRAGALWAFAEEPGVAHIVGRSRDVALVFFEEVLALTTVSERTGFIGDAASRTFAPVGIPPTRPTSWLPTERTARAWQALLAEVPPVEGASRH
jgi:pimeloyl-ACP methyl ester carboxylesterase